MHPVEFSGEVTMYHKGNLCQYDTGNSGLRKKYFFISPYSSIPSMTCCVFMEDLEQNESYGTGLNFS